MVDHLSIMGIQRWQQRENSREIINGINAETKGKAVDTLDHVASTVISDDARVVVNTAVNVTEEDAVIHGQLKNKQLLSAYAATSVRRNRNGEDAFWLWVVPQSTLPANELQLLDKIVTATGSSWQASSLADNYLENNELTLFLQNNLTAIIVLAERIDWPEFYEHELYSKQQCLLSASLNDLLNEAEKKREMWHSLQQLMTK